MILIDLFKLFSNNIIIYSAINLFGGFTMDMPKLNDIIKVMKNKGYVVFRNPQGFDLNIVGIRTDDMTSNKFNDWITVFYINDGAWSFSAFPASCDPGTFYRLNPMNVKGTSILKPGQYRSSHKIGRHKGYKALVQEGKNPLTVYRDANMDNVLDMNSSKEDTGFFGINIHKANATSLSQNVDRWSAGCQVIQSAVHFNFFMNLCDQSSAKYGNYFTYTLLTENDFNSLI